MKKPNKTAFTLAEVLIALTIIGVAAALTIPTLIQRTNKQEYVSALQKAYAVLSQASQMITAENGSPKCNDGGWACSMDDIYKMYKKYLSNAKECAGEKGCMTQDYKLINGNYYANWDDYTGERRLILADGTIVHLRKYASANNIVDCNFSEWGTNDICFNITVDINGEKKPNQLGRDLFSFHVQKDGRLTPAGCNFNNEDCTKDGYGYSCTCKVLREGKMDY